MGTATGNVRFWDGDSAEALPGRTLYKAGIHFAGGTILHWPDGADGQGALCTGDIFQVVEDRRWLSFMYSYPNLIPEHPDTIRRAVRMVEPLAFEVIYGAWWGKVVTEDAKGAVVRSARRYFEHIGLESTMRRTTDAHRCDTSRRRRASSAGRRRQRLRAAFGEHLGHHRDLGGLRLRHLRRRSCAPPALVACSAAYCIIARPALMVPDHQLQEVDVGLRCRSAPLSFAISASVAMPGISGTAAAPPAEGAPPGCSDASDGVRRCLRRR